MKDGPTRTCVGCREARPKRSLVRLVRGADGVVTVDRAGTSPGRGAYVCAVRACLALAVQRGRLAHAFRARSLPSPTLAEDALGGGAVAPVMGGAARP
jgi:uncharacterized protein